MLLRSGVRIMSAELEASWIAANGALWIAEARGGSRPALEHLLQACCRYLLALANRELGAALRSRLDPVDIVQDTLMKAWRSFPQFQGKTEADWLAWLRQILLHNLANERRRHVRTVMRSIRREVRLAEASLVLLPEHPGREAQAREQDEALEDALRRLPERYRQVLRLHTQEELTFTQVGEHLHCSAEAIRKLWGRAAEHLARNLGDSRQP
jgi:RNA polymerase sigma-70 factor (ECF subfamily)